MKLENLQPKNVQAPRPAPEGFCDKPHLALLYSSKGTGKTNTLVNMAKAYDRHRFFQKVILFSPTYRSDPKYEFLKEGSYEFQQYDNYTNEVFKEVLDDVYHDLHEWREYERLKALYEKSKRIRDVQNLTDEEALELFMMDWREPDKPRFDKEPYTLLIFDDQASNKQLMSNGKSLANSFFLLHRHARVSCWFASQIYKNAVPKMIRNNLDWWIMGPSKSEETMASVAEELDSYASKKEIVDMWARATSEPYHYFTVNLQVPAAKRFTQNFDQPIPSATSE